MGENTAISWCDDTFNIWNGRQRVSPGCENCYAEALDDRFASVRGSHWGPTAQRQMFGDAHWAKPLSWDRKAAASGIRRRVFCSSTADVFESRAELAKPRNRLWELIDATPWLDWLLLTKRPENFDGMLPWWAPHTHYDHPPNVWLGVTAENQEYADKRIPILIRTPCAKRFVSYEPALGPINFAPFLMARRDARGVERSPIDWVIYGDESGHNRRPSDLQWARDTRDVCDVHGVAFHFKQSHLVDPAIAGDRDKRGKIHLPILDGKSHPNFPTT